MRLIDAYKLAYRDWDEIGCKCVLDQEIEDAPTVDAKPVVHAKWIKGYRLCETYSGVLYPKKNKHFQYCSKCAAQFDIRDNETERFDYCPECGAKMDEMYEKEEEK